MNDLEGVQFLQWCLPRLHLRWPGFRKVRRQIYKRIDRRLVDLGLASLAAYRDYLDDHEGEWAKLDALCWIHISRFYRDRGVFEQVEHEILPLLAQTAMARGEGEIHCWSAGCAGGEEPYSLAIIWQHSLAKRFATLHLRVIATDIDPASIRRAERGCYHTSSLKELPAEWRSQAFVAVADALCLKVEYRAAVTFLVQDIREVAPDGPFDLILCRNLAFTYFDKTLQEKTMQKIIDRLVPGGALVIGSLESLPPGRWKFAPWSVHKGIYRKPPVEDVPSPKTSQG